MDRAGPMILVVMIMLLGNVSANNSVLIKSKSGQSLTSSTLHWVAVSAGRMPDDAVEGGQGSYVCRFQHAGRLEIGATDEEESSSCRIVYYGQIIIRDKFEVLVNVQQAGRLVWTKWDRSHMSFIGAVQVGEQYVGRVKTADGQQYRLGHLDPTIQRGRIFTIDHVEDQVVQSNEGEILLEIEAIDYDLGAIQAARNRRKIQSQEEVRLAHTILDNMEDSSAGTVVASTLSYVVTHSVYLSHVRGMIKGLPASMDLGGDPPLVSGGTVHFRWGDPSISGTFPQLMEVSHRLERGTAVNVSLTARRITFDGPFNAQLSTTYSDQFVGRRQIDGQARQTVLEDIRLQYGDVYFVNNGSLVPGTTTSSTTTITPTTTSMASSTTTTQSQPSSSVTLPPSLKQTKETLELKSRNVSSNSNSLTSTTTSHMILILILFIGR